MPASTLSALAGFRHPRNAAREPSEKPDIGRRTTPSDGPLGAFIDDRNSRQVEEISTLLPFAKAAAAAHPGDVLTVSELFRLSRDLLDIHNVRNWCQARGVALRVLSGPLSNFHDLAANDATTALIINVITSVGQFQRDLQNELTDEGIAAAEAEGRYRGRPPALEAARRDHVRTAFRDERTSIAALARAHGVSRAAVRTALADLLPGQPG
jgi:DNA invertase Pin-like site-specific DNA recombinase